MANRHGCPPPRVPACWLQQKLHQILDLDLTVPTSYPAPRFRWVYGRCSKLAPLVGRPRVDVGGRHRSGVRRQGSRRSDLPRRFDRPLPLAVSGHSRSMVLVLGCQAQIRTQETIFVDSDKGTATPDRRDRCLGATRQQRLRVALLIPTRRRNGNEPSTRIRRRRGLRSPSDLDGGWPSKFG
jgi:hypothetical protein